MDLTEGDGDRFDLDETNTELLDDTILQDNQRHQLHATATPLQQQQHPLLGGHLLLSGSEDDSHIVNLSQLSTPKTAGAPTPAGRSHAASSTTAANNLSFALTGSVPRMPQFSNLAAGLPASTPLHGAALHLNGRFEFPSPIGTSMNSDMYSFGDEEPITSPELRATDKQVSQLLAMTPRGAPVDSLTQLLLKQNEQLTARVLHLEQVNKSSSVQQASSISHAQNELTKLEKERRALEQRLKQLSEAQERLLPSILSGPYAALPEEAAGSGSGTNAHHNLLLRVEFLCDRYTKAIERLQERIKKLKTEKRTLQRQNQRLRTAIDSREFVLGEDVEHFLNPSSLPQPPQQQEQQPSTLDTIHDPAALEALLQQNEELKELLQSSLETLEEHQARVNDMVHVSELRAANEHIARLERELASYRDNDLGATDEHAPDGVPPESSDTVTKLSVQHLRDQAEQLIEQDMTLTGEAQELVPSLLDATTLAPSSAPTPSAVPTEQQQQQQSPAPAPAFPPARPDPVAVASLVEKNEEQAARIEQLSAFSKLIEEHLQNQNASPTDSTKRARTASAISHSSASNTAGAGASATAGATADDTFEQADSTAHLSALLDSDPGALDLPRFMRQVIGDQAQDCWRFLLDFSEFICKEHLAQSRLLGTVLMDNTQLINKLDSALTENYEYINKVERLQAELDDITFPNLSRSTESSDGSSSSSASSLEDEGDERIGSGIKGRSDDGWASNDAVAHVAAESSPSHPRYELDDLVLQIGTVHGESAVVFREQFLNTYKHVATEPAAASALDAMANDPHHHHRHHLATDGSHEDAGSEHHGRSGVLHDDGSSADSGVYPTSLELSSSFAVDDSLVPRGSIADKLKELQAITLLEHDLSTTAHSGPFKPPPLHSATLAADLASTDHDNDHDHDDDDDDDGKDEYDDEDEYDDDGDGERRRGTVELALGAQGSTHEHAAGHVGVSDGDGDDVVQDDDDDEDDAYLIRRAPRRRSKARKQPDTLDVESRRSAPSATDTEQAVRSTALTEQLFREREELRAQVSHLQQQLLLAGAMNADVPPGGLPPNDPSSITAIDASSTGHHSTGSRRTTPRGASPYVKSSIGGSATSGSEYAQSVAEGAAQQHSPELRTLAQRNLALQNQVALLQQVEADMKATIEHQRLTIDELSVQLAAERTNKSNILLEQKQRTIDQLVEQKLALIKQLEQAQLELRQHLGHHHQQQQQQQQQLQRSDGGSLESLDRGDFGDIAQELALKEKEIQGLREQLSESVAQNKALHLQVQRVTSKESMQLGGDTSEDDEALAFLPVLRRAISSLQSTWQHEQIAARELRPLLAELAKQPNNPPAIEQELRILLGLKSELQQALASTTDALANLLDHHLSDPLLERPPSPSTSTTNTAASITAGTTTTQT